MNRNKWMNRICAALLGMVLVAGSFTTTAEAADIVSGVDISSAVGATKDISSVTDDISNITQDITSSTKAKDTTTVHFFAGESYYNLQFDKKPSKQEILNKLPSRLTAYVGDYYQKVTISVTWTCAENYEDSYFYYYQFNPVWNTKKYKKNKNTVIPYAICTFDQIDGVNGDSNSSTKEAYVSKGENAQTIYSFLLKKGFNEAAASGILANIQAESNFNPKALGDHGTSYGICQWHNGRYTRLQTYCENNGYAVSSLKGQLNFLMYELKSSYSGIYHHMRYNITNSTQGAYDAAYYWCYYFERPANKTQVACSRGNIARSVYKKYR